MTYHQFLEQLIEYLTRQLPPGTDVRSFKTLKNNGHAPDCLTISSPDTVASPVLYPEQYYRRLENQESFTAIAEEILAVFVRHDIPFPPDFTSFADFSVAKNHIVFKLIHTARNAGLLNTIPHFPFLDLSVVFLLLLPCEDTAATILIKNSFLEFWELNAVDLISIAGRNSRRLLEYEIVPMESVLKDVLSPKEKEAGIPPIYVLSNRLHLFGAGCLLYPDILSEFSRRHNCDTYILPSSVHEVLLLPASDAFSTEELTQIVCQVNDEHVSTEEFLSDHAYLYSRKEQKIIF